MSSTRDQKGHLKKASRASSTATAKMQHRREISKRRARRWGKGRRGDCYAKEPVRKAEDVADRRAAVRRGCGPSLAPRTTYLRTYDGQGRTVRGSVEREKRCARGLLAREGEAPEVRPGGAASQLCTQGGHPAKNPRIAKASAEEQGREDNEKILHWIRGTRSTVQPQARWIVMLRKGRGCREACPEQWKKAVKWAGR